MNTDTLPRTISVSEMARDVGLHVGTVLRWVHQWSRYDERIDSGDKGVPATCPYSYLSVARAWAQERDAQVRNLMRLILRESPNNFFVMVGTSGYSCYDREQANKVIEGAPFPIRAYYLGPPTLQTER